ncbi:Uncharacterised protein [Mycobacteroides abscessus subsp. abscessus]|nr:Uncharacterised protein [Mycobacteroides abscessus subsp. abscessus]
MRSGLLTGTVKVWCIMPLGSYTLMVMGGVPNASNVSLAGSFDRNTQSSVGSGSGSMACGLIEKHDGSESRRLGAGFVEVAVRWIPPWVHAVSAMPTAKNVAAYRVFMDFSPRALPVQGGYPGLQAEVLLGVRLIYTRRA